MNEFTQINLDCETLSQLVNLCTLEGKTPSEVISGIIHDKAIKAGLILPEAKSA